MSDIKALDTERHPSVDACAPDQSRQALIWEEMVIADRRWVPQRINVAMEDRLAQRPGWVCDELPGLALVVVWEEGHSRTTPLDQVRVGAELYPKSVSLTHVPSGLLIIADPDMTTITKVAVLSQEVYGVDWSLPKDALLRTRECLAFRSRLLMCRRRRLRLSLSRWLEIEEELAASSR